MIPQYWLLLFTRKKKLILFCLSKIRSGHWSFYNPTRERRIDAFFNSVTFFALKNDNFITLKYSLLKNGFTSNKIHGKVSISAFWATRIYEKRRTIYKKNHYGNLSDKQKESG